MNKITFVQHGSEALHVGAASGLTVSRFTTDRSIDTPFIGHNDTLYSLNGVINLTLLADAGLLVSSLTGHVDYTSLAKVYEACVKKPKYIVVQTTPRKAKDWFENLHTLLTSWGYAVTAFQLAACMTGQACKRERVYFIASQGTPVSTDRIIRHINENYKPLGCMRVHTYRYFGNLAGACLTASDQGCAVRLWPAPSNDKPYTNPLFALWLLGWNDRQFSLRKVAKHPATHFPLGAAEAGPWVGGEYHIVAEYEGQMRIFPKDAAFHPDMEYALHETHPYVIRSEWNAKLTPLYSPAWVTPHLQLIVNRLIEHETGVEML